jgi:hypothetical protein
VFCHFDGAELRAVGTALNRVGGDLGREFVFPSGRRCRTYDELARGCSEEWNAARNMLKQGSLRQFMAGIGRMDLALAADRAASQADPDLGLDQFIAQFPVRNGHGPKLDLEPRRFKIGPVKVGQSVQVKLSILNQGTGLLHGTLQVEGDDWIRLAQDVGTTVPIKTGKQQAILFNIDTFGLPAGGKFAAKLTVITNGGAVEVPVALELQATPFAYPPLEGAANPRDLAQKIKMSPKAAIALLEGGEVQRWFAANGWRYPVQGPAAKGMAGVQQFFEGMGVSKPPNITVSDQEVLMICRAGQTVSGHVTLKTDAKKWVYARVESDSPWLTVDSPDIGGAQQATIDFQASAAGLVGGKTADARLTILANGGQRFTVTVRLDVRAARISFNRAVVRSILTGALAGLLLRFLLSLPHVAGTMLVQLAIWLSPDTGLGRLLETGQGPGLVRQSWRQFGAWVVGAIPDHYGRDYALGMALLGMLVGAVVLFRRTSLRHMFVVFDVLAGVIAGGVTGLVAGATLSSLLQILDAAMWGAEWPNPAFSAILGWTVIGLGFGLLTNALGPWGRNVIARIGQPLGRLFRGIGLGGFAELLAGE